MCGVSVIYFICLLFMFYGVVWFCLYWVLFGSCIFLYRYIFFLVFIFIFVASLRFSFMFLRDCAIFSLRFVISIKKWLECTCTTYHFYRDIENNIFYHVDSFSVDEHVVRECNVVIQRTTN